MFPTFRRERGFPPSLFPPPLTYRSKLALASPLVGFLASRPKPESVSFQLEVAASGFRLVAFTPWDNFNSTHFRMRNKGKKIKIPCTFNVQTLVFLQRGRWAGFPRRRAHTLSTEFSTQPSNPSEFFLMKGFCKQSFDRFSRCRSLARASFRGLSTH
jgi:hypothetical protein